MAGHPVLGLDLGQDRIQLPTDVHGHGDVADERWGPRPSVRIAHRGRRADPPARKISAPADAAKGSGQTTIRFSAISPNGEHYSAAQL